ncbi:MAG: hypothetical protein SFY32_14175 [Bacteroidota bacterium]|nr:hypothetical protein [Bacteroidota bacterium]
MKFILGAIILIFNTLYFLFNVGLILLFVGWTISGELDIIFVLGFLIYFIIGFLINYWLFKVGLKLKDADENKV